MTLHEKLIEIRKEVDYLQKDAQGYNSKYVSGTSILTKIRPKMDELGVLLTTDIVSATLHIQAKEHIISANLKFTWVNSSDPADKIEVFDYGFGQDSDTSKAMGKLKTYSERYFLLKFFNVPTDDDDPASFKKNHSTARLTEEQKQALSEWITAAGSTEAKVLSWLKVKSVDEMTEKDFNKAVEALKTKASK